jgi:hypothetical protein
MQTGESGRLGRPDRPGTRSSSASCGRPGAGRSGRSAMCGRRSRPARPARLPAGAGRERPAPGSSRRPDRPGGRGRPLPAAAASRPAGEPRRAGCHDRRSARHTAGRHRLGGDLLHDVAGVLRAGSLVLEIGRPQRLVERHERTPGLGIGRVANPHQRRAARLVHRGPRAERASGIEIGSRIIHPEQGSFHTTDRQPARTEARGIRPGGMS